MFDREDGPENARDQPNPEDRETSAGAGAGPAPENGPPAEDPLQVLRDRVRAAQEAAERAAAEAGAARRRTATGASNADSTGSGTRERDAATNELTALTALVDLLRTAIPPELEETFLELVRQVLIALRALIDWCLERLEEPAKPRVEVEDIPIS